MNEKLTAYVLNELPADERAALEAQMQTDPELQAQVEEVKTFCELLNQHVSKPEVETLTSVQRDEVLNAFQQEHKIVRPFWKHPAFLSTSALAACLTLVLVVNLNEVQKPTSMVETSRKEIAQNVPAPAEISEGRSNVAPQQEMLKQKVADAPMDAAKKPGNMPDGSLTVVAEMRELYNDVSSLKLSAGFMAPDESAVAQTALKEMEAAAQMVPPPPAAAAPMIAGNDMPQQPMSRLRQNENLMPTKPMPRPLPSPVPSESWGDVARDKISSESYAAISENVFKSVTAEPLSTFSIDVDTASYANVRRFLNRGQSPPADAVRLEELLNYFPYDDAPPTDGKPFAVHVDIAEAPWSTTHRLARIALKGREIKEERGTANFVFLIDVSGSMNSPDKLPLVQQSLKMLVGQLKETDRVALVVYAGNSGLILPSTAASEKEAILQSIEKLQAGGSTNGASGIRMAYEQAEKYFVKGGVNRVILCSDGDFNVGISSPEELQKLITEKAKSGVFLSVLGFGTGNLKDRTMETLADKGNGNYAYIDSISEARKVFVEQMHGTLVTIAKDVKIQVEFNPAQVSSYRLIGYENRVLAKEDFNDDKKDAGEIGAGHTVTALYEIVPTNVQLPDGRPLVDDLKYAAKSAPAPKPVFEALNVEIMTVKLRYKQPDSDKSELLEVPVTDSGKKLDASPTDFQFVASVAGFGMLLRDSSHAGELTWENVRQLARNGKGHDALGYRGEFLQLIDKAEGLSNR